MSFQLRREMARQILRRAEAFDWTVQGFGMLRLYLGDVGRVHLWDSRLAVDNVSIIHNHPWDLQSEILNGRLQNIRYRVTSCGYPSHWTRVLVTGEGGGLVEDPAKKVSLDVAANEWYDVGDRYSQTAAEIHESVPVDGTVTLMARPHKHEKQYASVYWPLHTHWVSAEPRPATREEVIAARDMALERWTK